MRTELTQNEQHELMQYVFHTPSTNVRDTPQVRIMHRDCAEQWHSHPYNFFRGGPKETNGIAGTHECSFCFKQSKGSGLSEVEQFFTTSDVKSLVEGFFGC